MPEYLSPGVYVEEFEIGAKPIEGVGTSTAGFVGMTERGSLKPDNVNSLTDFVRKFGGYQENSLTAYAVEGFFKNGGQKCFISRVVKKGAEKAALSSLSPLSISATGPGLWGKRVGIRIEDAAAEGETLFKLTAVYWSCLPKDEDFPAGEAPEETKKLRTVLEQAALVEVYDNLSTEKASQDHFLKRINNISKLITIAETDECTRPGNTGPKLFVFLDGGTDGTEKLTREDMRGSLEAKAGERTGLMAFEEIDEINILYAPDMYAKDFDGQGRKALVDDLLSQAETLKDRFVVLDVPSGSSSVADLKISTDPLRRSKYGAVYYPWIKVYDPLVKRDKLIPAGGHVCGIYARSDIERGVHKAPANEQVRGVNELEFSLTKGEQDLLNPRGINSIRSFQGRGILVWGARTLEPDPLWKYVNVRRLFIFLEESINQGTQWVVFEPNDIPLWARVKQSVTQFLTGVWRGGALMGATPEEAFFVKCDRTTMTQDDIDNGRLICVIGVAPVKPAEFVIIRIAQWTAGAK